MFKRIVTSIVVFSAVFSNAVEISSIGVVNIEKVRMETKAGKSIAEQITKLQADFQNKITGTEKDFDAKRKELEKQQTVLSKDAFAKKESEFNNKITEARNSIKSEAEKIEQAQRYAITEFDTIAFEVIKSIADENKYTHILPAGVVVYFNTNSDITSHVIAGIDKKLDKFPLKLDQKSNN